MGNKEIILPPPQKKNIKVISLLLAEVYIYAFAVSSFFCSRHYASHCIEQDSVYPRVNEVSHDGEQVIKEADIDQMCKPKHRIDAQNS